MARFQLSWVIHSHKNIQKLYKTRMKLSKIHRKFWVENWIIAKFEEESAAERLILFPYGNMGGNQKWYFGRKMTNTNVNRITHVLSDFFSSDYNPHPDWSSFLTTETTKTTKAKSGQRKQCNGSPLSFFTFSRKPTKPDVPKGSPLWNFFRHCATFSKIFKCPQRVPPFIFFTFLT